MKFRILAVIAIAMLTFSCRRAEDNPTVPTDSFLLRITVTDTSGNPYPGVIISAWNHLSINFSSNHGITHSSHGCPARTLQLNALPDSFILRQNYPNPFNPTTTFEFYHRAGDFWATVDIVDLRNNIVTTLIDRQWFVDGEQAAELDASSLHPGVYKVRLFASSDSMSSLSIRDSIFVQYLTAPDPIQSRIGHTESNGIYETTNDLFFPHLFHLPLLMLTSGGPDALGTYSIRDTVTIVLSDTVQHRSQSYDRVIRNGTNEFHLTLGTR